MSFPLTKSFTRENIFYKRQAHIIILTVRQSSLTSTGYVRVLNFKCSLIECDKRVDPRTNVYSGILNFRPKELILNNYIIFHFENFISQ